MQFVDNADKTVIEIPVVIQGNAYTKMAAEVRSMSQPPVFKLEEDRPLKMIHTSLKVSSRNS